ncbi:MAG: hypothetical protein ACJA0V_004422, partial [Planctomycetota bacterium]
SGGVIVAGGFGDPGSALNSAEVYNVTAGTFATISNMLAARPYAQARLLPSTGRLLLVGDAGNGTSELFR